jgi:hypothetical protein
VAILNGAELVRHKQSFLSKKKKKCQWLLKAVAEERAIRLEKRWCMYEERGLNSDDVNDNS